MTITITEPVRFPVADAHDGARRFVTVSPDAHGCTIEIEGREQKLVLDFACGVLHVFMTNENGEVDQPFIAAIGSPASV
jgi:hypothetical protein